MAVSAKPKSGSSFMKRWRAVESQEARLAWTLISPTAIIVFGLVIFPAVFSVWVSFHDVGLNNLNDVFNAPLAGPDGLDNYRKVFDDFAFKFQGLQSWGAAVTSVVYSFVATIATLVVGLIAAILMNRPFRGRGLTRAIFLIPYVAPVISMAFVWRWILDPRPSGVLNDLLIRLSVIEPQESIAYLATRGLALALVIVFEAWRYFPFAMLMILARLQAIDSTLYEAAEVDGASTWQKFWNVTIPELRYVLGAIFLLRLMWTFNKFDDIFLLTSGGFGTKVLPVLTYEFSFKLFDFGKGAATAMILLAILVVFMAFYIGIVMRNIEEE
ncbi:MAG: sugar ABC transporter permease [Chloroflexi bacterium]|nr:MAG: sugar ABC transporter permease [Chloroflexota bacterium]MBL1195463.1 sugar ABC transporter permease [Chloroflexota bacterium]